MTDSPAIAAAAFVGVSWTTLTSIASPVVAAVGWYVVYRLNLRSHRKTRKATQVDASTKLIRDVARAAVQCWAKVGDSAALNVTAFQITVDIAGLSRDIEAIFDRTPPIEVKKAQIRFRQIVTADIIIDPKRAAAAPNDPAVIAINDAGHELETAIRDAARARYKIDV